MIGIINVKDLHGQDVIENAQSGALGNHTLFPDLLDMGPGPYLE